MRDVHHNRSYSTGCACRSRCCTSTRSTICPCDYRSSLQSIYHLYLELHLSRYKEQAICSDVSLSLNDRSSDCLCTLILTRHTSGTTGIPKPIIWTHETCNQVLQSKACTASGDVPTVEGHLVNGKRVIVTLPPFHVSSVPLLL